MPDRLNGLKGIRYGVFSGSRLASLITKIRPATTIPTIPVKIVEKINNNLQCLIALHYRLIH